jgi:MFS family permease
MRTTFTLLVRPSSGGIEGEVAPPPRDPEEIPPLPDIEKRSLRYMMSIYGDFKGSARRLLAASFLTAIGGGMSWFVLILYIHELFPDLSNVGYIFSIASWTIVFFILPSGWLVDRFDHRKMLALALFISGISMAMFAMVQELWMIVLAQILNGASNALTRPAFSALMTEKTSDQRRKYLFALQSMVSMIGVAIASAMAGAWTIIARETFAMELEEAYRVMFVLAAMTNMLAVVIALAIRPGEEGREDKKEELPSLVDGDEDAAEARRKGLRFIVRFSTPMAFIGFGAGFVVPYFQLYYILKFDIDVAQVAWLFVATQVAMGLSFFFIPNLAERRGSVNTVVLTQAIAVINLALIPFAPIFLMAAPFHLMRMAMMNASTPIQNSLMMGAVRSADRGKAAAVGQLMWTVTNSIGITFAGFVMDNYGLDTPFIIAVSFYSAAVVLFWYWFRNVGEM